MNTQKRNSYLGQMESSDLIKLARDLTKFPIPDSTRQALVETREAEYPLRELVLLELSLRLEVTLARREREIIHDKRLGI